MFILDTNILSEMMHLRRVPELAAWIEGQDENLLFTTAISHADIFSGLAIMTDSKRRREVEKTAHEMFEAFEGRILPFNTEAATAYAELFAMRRKAGRPPAPLDRMIASIARSRGATIVTRNTPDFEGYGLTLINPWKTS